MAGLRDNDGFDVRYTCDSEVRVEMRPNGRLLLSLVLAGTVIAVFGFERNGIHLLNDAWHPHAKFHLVELTGFGIAMSALGLRLL